jgi:hypothetical protein
MQAIQPTVRSVCSTLRFYWGTESRFSKDSQRFALPQKFSVFRSSLVIL